MSQLEDGVFPPGFGGQSKTVFVSEGISEAVLVTATVNGESATPMTFATAELALAWCRTNGAVLVYLPHRPDPALN